jgi:ubiquinol-cytochrome c reductase iron-sulfur subunit
MKLWQWLFALIFGRLLRRGTSPETARGKRSPAHPRIVSAGTPERSAENLVLVFLGLAVMFALSFIVVYGEFSARGMSNALLGICIGASLLCIAAALTVIAHRLVVTEELEDEYPQEHPAQQQEVAEIVHESGSRITRKRLLIGAGAAAGGTLGLAALTPALSLGPVWHTAPLDQTPWRRGVRLVDDQGTPLRADGILHQSYYTAFAEGADKELLGTSLVVIRLDPDKLQLPQARADWAPEGIMAYSKICPHAGCAVALYRKPKFPAVQPSPALVCPCHYSTFDPFTGGTVVYGPAGRGLPQLPLMIDGAGHLRAAGNFSARVGPSWWNVREPPTSA